MALQIMRRIGGAAAAPATLEAGQLAYNAPTTGTDALYVGDGTNVNPLVSDQRQVELAGAQTITGDKTIAVGNLHITGGTNGQTLATDGSGGMSFVSAPPASVVIDATSALDGNGLVATPLTLTVATGAQVTAGIDDVNPTTSASLRQLMGADVATLLTTATTVVPALNELYNAVQALGAPLLFVGTYDGSTNQVTAASGGPATDGALPAPAAANHGWIFIVTVAGTGVAPAPTEPMTPGDWLVSSGTAWIHLDLHQPATVAANVGVTAITGMTGNNVQTALEQLFAGLGVNVDGVTIGGDGSTATPLEVIGYDDGTY